MNGLSKRLQKLEVASCQTDWSSQLAELCDCARRKLSVADRDLLKEAVASRSRTVRQLERGTSIRMGSLGGCI
jgi:hypothetical protein